MREGVIFGIIHLTNPGEATSIEERDRQDELLEVTEGVRKLRDRDIAIKRKREAAWDALRVCRSQSARSEPPIPDNGASFPGLRG